MVMTGKILRFGPFQGFFDFDDFVFRAVYHQRFCNIGNGGRLGAVGIVADCRDDDLLQVGVCAFVLQNVATNITFGGAAV